MKLKFTLLAAIYDCLGRTPFISLIATVLCCLGVVAHGRHIGRYFLLNNIAITNNSTFPKIKLHYSISYCNKPNLII